MSDKLKNLSNHSLADRVKCKYFTRLDAFSAMGREINHLNYLQSDKAVSLQTS